MGKITGPELQAEDNRILAGLHPRVKAAIDRRDEARRNVRFGSKTLGERMADICERDASAYVPSEPVSAAKAEAIAVANAHFTIPAA